MIQIGTTPYPSVWLAPLRMLCNFTVHLGELNNDSFFNYLCYNTTQTYQQNFNFHNITKKILHTYCRSKSTNKPRTTNTDFRASFADNTIPAKNLGQGSASQRGQVILANSDPVIVSLVWSLLAWRR